MYEYGTKEMFPIEDVSYEINILGVKASALPQIFGTMLASLFLGSVIGIAALPIFFVFFVGLCLLANRLFQLEIVGEPLEYAAPAQNWHRRFSWVSLLIPTLAAIQHPSQRSYRGTV